MPNDCYNYLDAPDGGISLIADYISTQKVEWSSLPDTYLDFEKILPIPPEVEDWYGWRNENWGTRSNSYEGQVQDEGISFNTAWSPPVGAIVALAKHIGKSLRLIYDEPGMDFCGELSVDAKGRHCNKVYSPRSEAPDYLREDLMIDEEEELEQAWIANK
jgi:hypothetical protein